MIGTLFIQSLSPKHLGEHIDEYIAISRDVSDWKAVNFLDDRPKKWALSFSLWDDRPIAYCILSERNGAIHINQFMVSPEYRGEGVGSIMLAEAVKRGATTLKVHPENVGAIRFYERHGFISAATDNGYCVMRSGDGFGPIP